MLFAERPLVDYTVKENANFAVGPGSWMGCKNDSNDMVVTTRLALG
jgi:hypothetical protein